jgi:hypothetical protein
MRRVLWLALAMLCGGGAFSTAFAQKSAPIVTRDQDHDGVPDPRDRCRNTPPGNRVDANGCPVVAAPAQPAPQPVAAAPSPVLPTPSATTKPVTAAPPPGAPAAPGAPVTTQAAAPPGAAAAAPAGAAVVTPPVAVPIPVPVPVSAPAPAPARPAAAAPSAPAAAPPPVTDPTMTAGFWLPAYAGHTNAEQLDYARTMAVRLDSAIGALVDVFRGTTGTPIAGATNPNVLSAREKRRWTQCRLIQFDLTTISEAVSSLKDSITGGPALARATLNLADAFEGLQAIGECDQLGSMIEAPDRFAPWGANYEASARNFYKDWYPQLRTVHEADRAFTRALNPLLPAGRQVQLPGLPLTPPTIGAVR